MHPSGAIVVPRKSKVIVSFRWPCSTAWVILLMDSLNVIMCYKMHCIAIVGALISHGDVHMLGCRNHLIAGTWDYGKYYLSKAFARSPHTSSLSRRRIAHDIRASQRITDAAGEDVMHYDGQGYTVKHAKIRRWISWRSNIIQRLRNVMPSCCILTTGRFFSLKVNQNLAG